MLHDGSMECIILETSCLLWLIKSDIVVSTGTSENSLNYKESYSTILILIELGMYFMLLFKGHNVHPKLVLLISC